MERRAGFDQDQDPHHPAAQTAAALTLFADLRAEVLQAWRTRIERDMPHAVPVGQALATDAAAALYDDIVASIAGNAPQAPGGVPGERAGGRQHLADAARQAGLDADDLVRQLQIFRSVVFAALRARPAALSRQQGELVGLLIEQATRDALRSHAAVDPAAGESFMARLSHDLRNPLNVAGALAQLIQRRPADPRVAGLASRIVEKIAEADALIQALLDAATPLASIAAQLCIDHVDMLSLAEEVCAELPFLSARVRLAGEHIEGYWCPTGFRRVLKNLLSNAHKCGNAREPITVRVGRDPEQDAVLVSVHSGGRTVPGGDLARWLKRSERLEDIDPNDCALGLAYVQQIIEIHGGRLAIDSAEVRGTTFSVRVPIDARPFVVL